MYAKKLQKEDLEDLLKQNQMKDAIVVLKGKLESLEKLEVKANRIELEQALDNILIEDIKKIDRLLEGKAKEIFKAYILKHKMRCLKTVWRNVRIQYQETEIQNVKHWTEEIFQDIRSIVKAKTVEEFLKAIDKTKVISVFEERKI